MSSPADDTAVVTGRRRRRKVTDRRLRLVRLTDLLKSSAFGFSVQQLVDHLGVSERTVFRDLSLLREAGISAHYDPVKRAVTAKPHFPSWAMSLNAEQALVLALAARTSRLRSDGRLSFAIDEAIAALLARLPEQTRIRASRLVSSCLLETEETAGDRVREPVMQELILAISQDRPVRVRYRSQDAHQGTIQTKLTHCRLTVASGHCSLLGWSSLHRSWCRFELGRIHSVEVIDETSDASSLPARPWRTPMA